MNLDIASTLNFGDEHGMRQFMLDHYMVHLQTSQALTAKIGGIFSVIGLYDVLAENSIVAMMKEKQPTPQNLRDWLINHQIIHQVTEQNIFSIGLNAPDLSIVDFSEESQFYDWMYVHQEMHDYEQQSLGLT